MKVFLRKWRIIPEIIYINWHKEKSYTDYGLWQKWFVVDRYWGGRIIYFTIRYHTVVLDFRRNWIRDMIGEV